MAKRSLNESRRRTGIGSGPKGAENKQDLSKNEEKRVEKNKGQK
jgi:hypothetical protein